MFHPFSTLPGPSLDPPSILCCPNWTIWVSSTNSTSPSSKETNGWTLRRADLLDFGPSQLVYGNGFVRASLNHGCFFSKNTLTSRWSKRKKHSLYVWLQAAIHLMTTPSSKNAKYCQYCGLPVIRQNHEHTENHHDHPSTSTMTAVGHYQYFT